MNKSKPRKQTWEHISFVIYICRTASDAFRNIKIPRGKNLHSRLNWQYVLNISNTNETSGTLVRRLKRGTLPNQKRYSTMTTFRFVFVLVGIIAEKLKMFINIEQVQTHTENKRSAFGVALVCNRRFQFKSLSGCSDSGFIRFSQSREANTGVVPILLA